MHTSGLCLVAPVLLGLCMAAQAVGEDLVGSVGKAGQNQANDVLTIQLLLNQLPAAEGDSQPASEDQAGGTVLLDPDGVMGPATLAAIRSFQAAQLSEAEVTGLVEPDSPTLQRLNALVASQPLRDRIVRVSLGERRFWRNGQRTERDPRVSARLQLYWQCARQSYELKEFQDSEFQSGHPWSAVYISWVMLRAGAGEHFAYNDSHWEYVAAAKRNRIEGNASPFKAYRPHEGEFKLGDVVVKRRSTSTATYDNIELGHPTHGDIVVAISATELVTIGGNVSDSVTTTRVPLDSNGKIADAKYFAVVKVEE